MTTITEKMIKHGILHSTEAGAQIYQDGNEYFYQVSGWTVVGYEEEHYTNESRRYSSLQELFSSAPKGILYQAEGESERELVDRATNRMLALMDGEDLEKFFAIEEARMAEYADKHSREVAKIQQAQNSAEVAGEFESHE